MRYNVKFLMFYNKGSIKNLLNYWIILNSFLLKYFNLNTRRDTYISQRKLKIWQKELWYVSIYVLFIRGCKNTIYLCKWLDFNDFTKTFHLKWFFISFSITNCLCTQKKNRQLFNEYRSSSINYWCYSNIWATLQLYWYTKWKYRIVFDEKIYETGHHLHSNAV